MNFNSFLQFYETAKTCVPYYNEIKIHLYEIDCLLCRIQSMELSSRKGNQMQQDTERAALVKRAQHGDAEAFMEWMGSMREQLYRVAMAYMKRPDSALMAVEDASFSAYLHIRSLKNAEFASTWLTRILINACNQRLRQEKRTAPLEEVAEPTSTDDYLPSDLRDAVSRLPEELRSAVSVRYFGGMTVKDTAGVLGLPEGTVKTRLRKALSLLRVEMEVD